MMQGDPFSQFLQTLSIWWQLWGWRFLPIIGLIIVWITLFISYGLIRRILKKRVMKAGVPPDAINGLNLAIGLAFIYIAVMAFVIALPDIYSYFTVILGTSSIIIGAAIGLALGQAVRNFVSGLYVIFSRPFHVEDYVRIGNKEGVVKEISMNYTKILQPDGSDILVPNSVVLESDVTNYMFEKKKLEGLLQTTQSANTTRKKVLSKVSKVIEVKKVVRYVFPMAFHTSSDLRKLRTSFDQVCKQWEKKFGFQPLYEITEVEQFAFTYNFTIFSDSARKILEFKPLFMDKILNAIFLSETAPTQ
ncbi:MAG: mechanosensitive ion channel family protein [Candidatus Hodarchaeota archaeon]